jgi:hypothetical protein
VELEYVSIVSLLRAHERSEHCHARSVLTELSLNKGSLGEIALNI